VSGAIFAVIDHFSFAKSLAERGRFESNQLAFLSAALLSARQASKSSHDLTKAAAPSR
jgi:hypothetical protein